MNINKFVKECSRREVFKLLSIYVVSSWVLLQVLALIADPIGLPEKSVSVLILVLIIGFPLYIIYIWKIRLSNSWASDEDDSSQELLAKSKFRQMYFTSVGIILFISGLSATLIFNNTFSGKLSLPKIAANDKIAVLKFDNLTSDNSLDIVGEMAASWISHGITENNAGQIITQDIVKDYASAMTTQNKKLTNNEILSTFFSPGKKIIGTYFLDGQKLIFQSSITDGLNGKILISLEQVECDSENPLDCIKDLRQEIVGYLVDKQSGDLSLENNPPKYEAYKALLEAKASKLEDNQKRYLELLNKAIQIDSNYFEPKSLMIGHYYNINEFGIADSLLNNINQSIGISERQRTLNNLYRAAIDGDSRKVHIFNDYEYKIIPYHLETNATQMIIALQFVNKPEEVESVFEAESFEKLGIENCAQCVDRIWTMAYAFNELENYKDTIDLLEPYLDIINDRFFLLPLIRAYIASEQKVKADQLLKSLELRAINSYDWLYLNLYMARQLILEGQLDDAKPYLETVIDSKQNSDHDLLVAETYEELEDYKNAQILYGKLEVDNPNNFKVLAGLSRSYFVNGDLNKSDEYIDKMEALRDSYQYGEIDYRLAQVYATRKEEDKMFGYLLKSIAAGHRFTDEKYKNSSSFAKYLDSPRWNEILTYWH